MSVTAGGRKTIFRTGNSTNLVWLYMLNKTPLYQHPDETLIDSVLYLVGFENGKRIPSEQVKPCKICEKMIINSGVKEVITGEKEALHENRTGLTT